MGCCLSPTDTIELSELYPIRGKLNAENNESYGYLKSVGSNWFYNPNNVHRQMHTKLYRFFDAINPDGDNLLTMTKVLSWPNRMRMLVGAADDEIVEMKMALRKLFEACGVAKEGLEREDWVEAHQAFAEAERERIRRGEPSLIALVGNAYFDVFDKDGSFILGIQDMKTMMKAFQVPEEVAYTIFEAAGVDENEYLEREEIHSLSQKLWLEPYNSKYDPIYTYVF